MNKIMKLLVKTVLLVMVISNCSTAQNNSIFPLGEKAPNVHHTGDVWLSHLSVADSIFDYNIAVAKFAKGAKLDWHTHPKGQQLLIIEGEGLYQERGNPIVVVKKGDIVKCHPDIEHWHAATPDKGVTYLAITGNQRTVWHEAISEEFFQKINVDSIRTQLVGAEIIKLSRDKWQWMSDKNIEILDDLFHENSVFVHMGGSWGKEREIEIIESGLIHYKEADIHEVSINIIENTAILLNRITLLAVVGGNEVTNPFMVTEVYKHENGEWKLASLSFTKLLEQD